MTGRDSLPSGVGNFLQTNLLEMTLIFCLGFLSLDASSLTWFLACLGKISVQMNLNVKIESIEIIHILATAQTFHGYFCPLLERI